MGQPGDTRESKTYLPRLSGRGFDEIFETHARRVAALQKLHLLPNDWRSWLEPLFKRSMKRCPHTQRSLVEVENDFGVWGLEICVDCGVVALGPQCPHVSLTWYADGTALICNNCGHDGT
jgi:hypothetical protein